MTTRLRLLWLVLALGAALGAAQARYVREEQMDLPVQVTDASGNEVRRTIKVTLWHDPANPRPQPVLVLNHGRSAQAQGRAAVGRAKFTEASDYFVRRGFIVAVPTRIGYGVTGGDDVEYTGPCDKKHYAPGYAAATRQTLAVLEALRRRSDAAKDRAVVVGQSFGGTTAVAVAALNPPGVQLAINFAGGGGGNPETRPQRPCDPAQLRQLFRGYGATARIPSLWVYAENDRYFGPKHPRDWFDAYVAAGAQAELAQFPPHGEDGHSLFTRFPQVWQPRVSQFLDTHGFKPPAGSN